MSRKSALKLPKKNNRLDPAVQITDLKAQVRNSERVNVYIDGKYRLSLSLSQVVDLGVKVGREVSQEEFSELLSASVFGKLYARTLEYCLVRPRSTYEVQNYIKRKIRDILQKDSTEFGIDTDSTVAEIIERLVDKKYLDDKRFADWWVENRNIKKGVSRRKLLQELMVKRIDREVALGAVDQSTRNDQTEIAKIIAMKRNRYDKLGVMQYLARRGFSYSDIKEAVESAEL